MNEHPYAAEVEAERRGWYVLGGIVRSLTVDECLEPGYYRDPDWTVRDVVAHLGTWLALAQVQLERISAGTYEGHDIDVDAVNAARLDAMRDQAWDVAWVQAQAGRTRMLVEWFALSEPTDEAAWWVRKAGSEHFEEHLARLHEWAAELVARRPRDNRVAAPESPGDEGSAPRTSAGQPDEASPEGSPHPGA